MRDSDGLILEKNLLGCGKEEISGVEELLGGRVLRLFVESLGGEAYCDSDALCIKQSFRLKGKKIM